MKMDGILIKGMKKPKSCYTHKGRCCDFHICTWDETKHYCTLTKKEVKCNRIDKDCPLVEVKSHGNLIDAKALTLKIISNNFDSYDKKLKWVMDCIRNAPTVLEATE